MSFCCDRGEKEGPRSSVPHKQPTSTAGSFDFAQDGAALERAMDLLGRSRSLILQLSQLFAQVGGFGAILCGFDVKLDCSDAAYRVEAFAYGVGLAVAHAFELVGELVLLHGVGCGTNEINPG